MAVLSSKRGIKFCFLKNIFVLHFKCYVEAVLEIKPDPGHMGKQLPLTAIPALYITSVT